MLFNIYYTANFPINEYNIQCLYDLCSGKWVPDSIDEKSERIMQTKNTPVCTKRPLADITNSLNEGTKLPSCNLIMDVAFFYQSEYFHSDHMFSEI